MTHDEAALLAAILAGPDDDLLRLVYADWLEENGRLERAEFIRAQCELARLPGPVLATITGGRPTHADYPDGRCGECAGLPHKCRYHALESRARALLDKLQADESFPEMEGYVLSLGAADGPGTATLRRGFVDTVVDAAEGWAARADAILARQPVSGVRLTTWPRMHAEARPDGEAMRLHYRLEGREKWHPQEEVPSRAPEDGTPIIVRNVLIAEWPTVEKWTIAAAPPAEGDDTAITVTVRIGSTSMSVAQAAAALRASDPPRPGLAHRILRGIGRLFGADD